MTDRAEIASHVSYDLQKLALPIGSDPAGTDASSNLQGNPAVVHSAAQNSPDQAATPLSELRALTPTEHQQIVIDWNRTQRPFPDETGVPGIFEAQAERCPDQIALEHGDRRLTYRELNERANQLAHALKEAGGKEGSIIAVCMPRSIDLIVATLAILKVGGTYVPVDPHYPADRKSLMLAGASMVITVATRCGEFSGFSLRIIPVDDPGLRRFDTRNPSFDHNPKTALAILYTSGSTGKPKGVKIAHRAVAALVLNTNYITFTPSDAVAFRANICFDVALFEIWGPLLNGGRVVVIDHEVQLAPSLFVQEIARHQVTILWITTSLFHLIASEDATAFSGLKYVFIGGEILDPESVRRVLQQGPPGNLVNVYGPTETTTFSTTYRIESVDQNAKTIPIGKPIANTRVYLLDSNRSPVPVGALGEIYIGGAGRALGYFGAPELTEERFIADPFSTDAGERLYKTGDLARWLPDGSIDFVGRADFQVKIRGFRIELAEIETALKEHPLVTGAVVEVRHDGTHDKQLVAYVAGAPSKLAPHDLREFLKTTLPDYMIPSVFHVIERFPINGNGKIDRSALAQFSLAQARVATDRPRNFIEEQLAKIWEQVLGVKPIGIKDDFFDVGGDSLIAVRLANRAHAIIGIPIRAAHILEALTIEKLAETFATAGPVFDESPVQPSSGQTIGRSVLRQPDTIKVLPRPRQNRG